MLKLQLFVLHNDVKYKMPVTETLGKKKRLSKNVNLYKLYKQENSDAILLALSALHIVHTP